MSDPPMKIIFLLYQFLQRFFSAEMIWLWGFWNLLLFQTQQNIRTNRNWCLSSENPKIQEKVFRYSFFTICNKIRTNSKKNTNKWKDTRSNHLFVPLHRNSFLIQSRKRACLSIKILLENRVVSKIISISNNLRIHSDIGNLLQTFQILQPVKHAVSFRK